jgi:hypothetical protein
MRQLALPKAPLQGKIGAKSVNARGTEDALKTGQAHPRLPDGHRQLTVKPILLKYMVTGLVSG